MQGVLILLLYSCFLATSLCMAMTGATSRTTTSYRAESIKKIATSFQSRRYEPPFWAKNSHLHTILASGEVQRRFFGRVKSVPKYRRERWATADDDFFDVDFLDQPADEGNGCTAVLLHGLESTSIAPLTVKMAESFFRRGFEVAVVCFRSCSGEDNQTIGAYHMGFTDDIDTVIRGLQLRNPRQRFVLSGFSLGGNVISKYLGEVGHEATTLGIIGGAVACVPFDAVTCQVKIDKGFNQAVYSKNFLTSLIPKVQRKALNPRLQSQVSRVLDVDAICQVKTIGDFDDKFIAPIYNFKSNVDYYEKSQSGPFLKFIKVPLLAIQAIDDPFIESSTLPTEKDLQGAPVILRYHDYGGHCGFVSKYAEDNVEGWLPCELARFGEHIVKHLNYN
jgi:predicted alpha/beta-fold hydrolase